MEKFTNYILLSLVAIAILTTVIVTLRIRNKTHKRDIPDFGEVEDILTPLDNSGIDEVVSTVRIKDNPVRPVPMKQPLQKNQSDHALSDLGFGELSSMFVENDEEESTLDLLSEEIGGENDSKLIVINIMAKPSQQFIGYELLQALLSAGLRFGEMSIFHRYQDADRGGQLIFSLASATEPGIFDMNKMGAFTCKGLSLFMQLQAPHQNLAALELMMMTAQQLAEDLDGIVQDGNYKLLDESKLTIFRGQIKKHLQQYT